MTTSSPESAPETSVLGDDERPVLYLDVDDTLLIFPPGRDREWWKVFPRGAPSPGVREFLGWARANFEVRWLTMWAMRGVMHPKSVERLATLLQVPLALVEGCDNPLEHGGFKTQGINWDEHRAGREWFWVEDENSEREREVLRAMQAEDRFILTRSSHSPTALVRAMRTIQRRLNAKAEA